VTRLCNTASRSGLHEGTGARENHVSNGSVREITDRNADGGGTMTQQNGLIRALRESALRGNGPGLTDAELLGAFVSRHEAAAFEPLVRRHGPMVWGVCRRVLHNEADAEDAFQATFLVLVRKAASVRPRALVGNWLYGVAHNTALKAKAMNSKRRAKEQQAA